MYYSSLEVYSKYKYSVPVLSCTKYSSTKYQLQYKLYIL